MTAPYYEYKNILFVKVNRTFYIFWDIEKDETSYVNGGSIEYIKRIIDKRIGG